ncbi:MAG: S1-C subfamily serine protease [Candidatus Paceibacteria bacterium]
MYYIGSMQLEELTKQQIVLLALLVAFVSSTASAIVVVRLMEQAPVTSSPTINRVIERTVQQIIPGETKEITKINTVIIKEEDLIVEAINENKKSVVLIRESIKDELGSETHIVNGSGLYLEDGYIVSDGRLISGPGNYYIEDGDVRLSITFIKKDQSGFSILRVDESINLGDISFIPRTIKNSPTTLVGQRAIILSANPHISAFTGLISSHSPFLALSEAGEEVLFSKIDINIELDQSNSGGILVNSDGQVTGLIMYREGDIFAIPSSYINQAIALSEKSDVVVIDETSLLSSASTALREVE